MKLTIIQSTVLATKEENIAHIQELLKDPLDTDMIILPEMFITPYENEEFPKNSVHENSIELTQFASIAKNQKAYLILGSVPEQDQDKLYNTTFVFDPKGKLITKYRKMHLFEVTYPDGTSYKESDVLSRGDEIVTFDTPFGTVGLMICFDIRFPRQSMLLRQQGANLLIIPAAFNQYTGPLHWELAFRSRSVDNQVFTIGVSPSVDSHGKYNYYGHSIVVNPLGEVLFDAGEKETVMTLEIDLDETSRVRNLLPIIRNEIDL